MASPVRPNFIELNLTSRHEEICDVQFSHEFFKDKFWTSVEIIPTEETQVLLRQAHILFRQDKKGFMLGYRQAPEVSHLDKMEKPLQLSFWIKNNDPYFLNYTELPFDISSEIYYFNNKFDNKHATDKKCLSSQEFVNGTDRIRVSQAGLKFEFQAPIFNPDFEIRNAFDEVVWKYEPTEEELDNFYEVSFININLNSEPSGKYSIYLNGIFEYDFYLLPQSFGKVFGVIDLFFDKDDTSVYSVFDIHGQVSRQHYSIQFKNRAIKWKYLLIENNPVPLHTDPQIFDSKKAKSEAAAIFEPPRETYLETGMKATLISSTIPIPLRENQDEKFKLRTKKGKTKIDWVVDLPCASPKLPFKINSENNSEIFSELLVYL